ncbi:unnamed protein product [Camellia sinensis]
MYKEYHEEGEIKEVQSNRRLKNKAVMEENTLINSSSSLVSGSEGESNTLESENWRGDFCNSDNIDSDSTEFEIAGLHYGPYSDDDGFRYETKEINFVWDG